MNKKKMQILSADEMKSQQILSSDGSGTEGGDISSGSGTEEYPTQAQIDACWKLAQGHLCDWYDEKGIKHRGRCLYYWERPYDLLYCDPLNG